MSAQQLWNLQSAVHTRLEDQLSGQGPGGSDPEITDHVPPNPDRVFVRLEGWNVVQRSVKCDSTQHFWFVTVYDRPTTGATSARGQKTSKQLLQKAILALRGWTPAVTGAGAVKLETGNEGGEDDPLVASNQARFSCFIGAS